MWEEEPVFMHHVLSGGMRDMVCIRTAMLVGAGETMAA